MSNFNGESLFLQYKCKPVSDIVDQIGKTIIDMKLQDIKRNEQAIANLLRALIYRYGGPEKRIELNPSHMSLSDDVRASQDPETGMISVWIEPK